MVGSSAFSWLLRGGSASRNSEEGRKKKGKRGEASQEEEELGVTEQLREFVKSFTIDTFKEFRLPTTHRDDTSTDVNSLRKNCTCSNNVQKDLTEWQERHALLMLSTVKEMSELRYALCPRHLKDKDFWRIYFLLVKKYVAPKKYVRLHKLRTTKSAPFPICCLEDE